jgi:hypothetical protein
VFTASVRYIFPVSSFISLLPRFCTHLNKNKYPLTLQDNIKENDIPALGSMLRRASLQIDISGINDAGEYIFKRQIMK